MSPCGVNPRHVELAPRILFLLSLVPCALADDIELHVNGSVFADPSRITATLVNQSESVVILPGRYPDGALLQERMPDDKWRQVKPAYCGTADEIEIPAGARVEVPVLWWLILGYPDPDDGLAKPADPARRIKVPAAEFPRSGTFRLLLEYRLGGQVSDRRLLQVHSREFRIASPMENKSPDAFEGLRHYEPEQLVDALDAILNQMTGQHFGFIYNGASDEERDSTVEQWREYLEHVGATGECVSHGT